MAACAGDPNFHFSFPLCVRTMDWLDNANEESGIVPSGPEKFPDETPLGQSTVSVILGGRYELQSLIAEGGFAQVWRARDKSLDRPVAIKVTTSNCW